MAANPTNPAGWVASQAATRLRFPTAFGVFLALFLFDLVIPDFVPFADEILLGLATAIFAMWRQRASPPPSAAQPPIKNVTPPGASGGS
ncbi:MAG: DUF6116 family protein [Thermoanaerobaculia bacterium]